MSLDVSVTKSRLSRRVLELSPSQTLALAARARALKAEGKDVIDFSAGEPDFTSPKVVAEAAKAAIEAGDTHYPPVPGTPALKGAIRERVAREYGFQAAADQILVSTGAKQVLFNLMQALLNPGDEVVYASPYWVSYPAMVQLAGGRGVPIPSYPEENFRLAPDAVEAALGPRCKVLILNSPSNPTGATINASDLQEIVEIALDKQVVVVSDEIYGGLVYDGAQHHSVLQLRDSRIREGVVLVDGVSKYYAMTGWRIGYAVGPQDIIKAAAKIQSQSTSGACSIAQAAAAAAITEGGDAALGMKDAFAKRRRVAIDSLLSIPGVRVPEARGAFYLFPDFSAYLGSQLDDVVIKNSLALSELLLEKALVAAVPGSAFGTEGHLRFSYALGEDAIREGLNRARELLSGATPQPRV